VNPAHAPLLNVVEGRLVLPRELLPTAMQVSEGQTPPQGAPETTALTTAGILVQGRLHPVADSILSTMVDPELVATIECTEVARPPTLSTIWGRGATGVVGESRAADMFTLHQTARGLLPFHVANLVSLGPRPAPVSRASVAVAAEMLAASRPQWHDPEVLTTLLRSSGVPDADAGAIAMAHAARRGTWRINALRIDTGGLPSDDDVLVLDGDAAGYWTLTAANEPPDTVRFEPIAWSEVLNLVGRLIPT